MCPVSLGTSQTLHTASTEAERTHKSTNNSAAKLWLLLVGVNHYQDPHLPDLQYSAIDCQGLNEALEAATVAFANKQFRVHHDNTASQPTLATIRASLEQIVTQAKSQDTILFYFSGHGFQDAQSQQAVLCLADTQKENLLATGLGLQTLLEALSQCAASQQLVWLDACHSGGMTLRGASSAGHKTETGALENPTPQLVSILRQQAARSSGFYALLSCDQNQRSWEFPELGHGVFTYYLMQGLRGEAANAQGSISADSLYRYVYYQTLQYIDKTNQQLRLINRQKQGKGEREVQTEYPLQTPKRIVEGIGENVLVLKAAKAENQIARRAVLIDGLGDTGLSLSVGKCLRQEGDFELTYWPQSQEKWAVVGSTIEQSLKDPASTGLLYIRGETRITDLGDSVLVLPEGTHISRPWLRQLLRSRTVTQQIVVLDCPNATDLEEWVEELSSADASTTSQPLAHTKELCIVAAASPNQSPNTFSQAILDTLAESDARLGLPVAGWITQLQGRLALSGITPHFWLAGKGIIEIVPSAKGQGEQTTLSDIGVCPYRGLRAFVAADAAFFFGREALVQQLLQAVNHRSFLAVVGASGSGKSSVVQAGLMAQLKQGKRIPGSDRWYVCNMRPGTNPLRALAQAMTKEKAETTINNEQLQIEGLLHLGPEGFVQWLRAQPTPMVVLIVDQFEELFTLTSQPERQQFLALVLGAIEHAGDRFKLIITLRSDFITPCLAVPELTSQLQNTSVLVPPTLSPEDYRQIILRPAEKVGLTVEPELVTVLLQDLDQGVGDLPLLEFVLEQIWEKRKPGQLSLQVYQDDVGGLSGALERKAQAVYDALAPASQDCARWIFLNLTQLGDGTADTRRRVSKSDLAVTKYPPALIEKTLQALTAAKLIVMNSETVPLSERTIMARGDITESTAAEGSNNGASETKTTESETTEINEAPVTIEVAHEILIRHWSTLRWWLEENRTRLRSQRQVEQAALTWKQNHHKPDFLLRGVPLDAAVELYIHHNDELPQDAQRFVEAGIAAREAEQQQAQKRLRQAQRAIALISVLALGAIGLGGTAYLQRQQARLQEIEALNALSSSQMANNQYLDATVTAIEAGTQLKSIRTLGLLNRQAGLVEQQTIGTLQQATTLSAERNQLEGHSRTVGSVAYSPDGQHLASASLDNTMKIWQPDGTLIRSITTIPNSSDYGSAISFSPDSQQIAIAHMEGKITLWQTPWDQTDPAPVRTLQAHTALVTAVAFSPDGTTLATAGRDEVIKLWNVADGQLIQTLTGHTGWTNAVSWSPDGRQLASGGEDKKLKIWEVASGELLWEKTEHRARVTSVDWSGTGEWIAVGEGDRTVKMWRVQDRAALTLGEHETGEGDIIVQVNSVRFSPDSQQLLSTGDDGTLRIWRVEDGRQINILRGHQGVVWEADWHPDGDAIASAGSDNGVRLWELAATREASKSTNIPSQNIDLYGAQFGSEGKRIAGINWDGSIELWAHENGVFGQKVRSLPEQEDAYVAQLDFIGDRLATANEDGIVRLWNVEQGVLEKSFSGHDGRVTVVRFSHAQSLLLSGGEDGALRLWDPDNGNAVRDWAAHEDEVSAIAWQPTGQLIASGARNGTVNVWDPQGNLEYSLPAHNATVSALTFSSEGKQLITASADQTIKVWNVKDGTVQHTLNGQQSTTALFFVENGQVLVSSGADIKLWNIRTGELLKTIEGTVIRDGNSLDISRDEQWLISSSINGGTWIQPWSLDYLLQKGCQKIRAYLSTNPSMQEKQICEEI
ncbi:MAG: caspase family protein [Cyanobacteria bacterium J06649_4]